MRDMVGSKIIALDLANFRFSPLAPSHPMPKGKVQSKAKNVQRASNIRSVASVSARGLRICWCEGFGVGCGRVRAESTRRHHAKQVRDRRESKYHFY